MGIESINNNPDILKKVIDRVKLDSEQYYRNNPDSLVPSFEKELRELGFDFEISNQTLGFMPKHKNIILPIAIKYYQLAKKQKKDNEQNHFISFFAFKGLEEVVPTLLEDYYSPETPDLTRWFISDCLYSIRSKKYVDEYLKIISNKSYGTNRRMIILLIGKLRVENAIPLLIELLEDEEVRLHSICALGDFKREEFRCYFERFQDSKHSGWRKYSRNALKKLDG